MKDYKFYIIDEDKDIIDYSDNMLELRLTCDSMNARIGGSCEVVSKDELDFIISEAEMKIELILPQYRAKTTKEDKTLEGTAILMDKYLVVSDGAPRRLYGGESMMDTKVVQIKKETIEMSFNCKDWYPIETILNVLLK